jgi:hypothetical protein
VIAGIIGPGIGGLGGWRRLAALPIEQLARRRDARGFRRAGRRDRGQGFEGERRAKVALAVIVEAGRMIGAGSVRLFSIGSN